MVIISTISVLVTTSPHKTSRTRFGKHWHTPHWLRQPLDVYNMDESGLFYRAQSYKTLTQVKVHGYKKYRKISHHCSCCKHGMHWQVETCEFLQVSTPNMLQKVVANKLCVVDCKPSGLDAIICIMRVKWWASMFNLRRSC